MCAVGLARSELLVARCASAPWVWNSYHSRDRLASIKQELQTRYGVKVHAIAEDLANPASADRIFSATEALGLTIDVLINNAGFGGHGKFGERELAAEQAMMQVNMVTLTNLTHHYLKGMVARRRGRILNVSSTASFMPGPLQAVYSGKPATCPFACSCRRGTSSPCGSTWSASCRRRGSPARLRSR